MTSRIKSELILLSAFIFFGGYYFIQKNISKQTYSEVALAHFETNYIRLDFENDIDKKYDYSIPTWQSKDELQDVDDTILSFEGEHYVEIDFVKFDEEYIVKNIKLIDYIPSIDKVIYL